MEQTTETVGHELSSSATMDLYRGNLFRILGLPITASASDIRRHQKRMAMKHKLGISNGGGQKGLFALTPPPDEHDIRSAHDRLNEPQIRLIDEIFWFWPLAEKAKYDPALQALEKGDLTMALDQWDEQGRNGDRSSVAAHNLAVHYHMAALDAEVRSTNIKSINQAWDKALFYWKEVLNGNEFWSMVKKRAGELDDIRLTNGFVRRIRETLPELLLKINADLALKAAEKGQPDHAQRQITYLRSSPFDEALIDRVLRTALSPIRQRIRLMCRAVAEKVEEDPKKADRITLDFIVEGTALLKIADLLLTRQDPVRIGLHDDIAGTALGGAISFGNETEAYKKTIALIEQCRPIALGDATLDRIEHNHNIVKNNMAYDHCFFCEDEAHDESSSIKNHMYGNVRDLGTRITWNHRPVIVPRCKNCQKKHNFANMIGVVAFLATAIVCAKIGQFYGDGLTPIGFAKIVWKCVSEGQPVLLLKILFNMIVYLRGNAGFYLGGCVGLVVFGPILFRWLRARICRRRYHIKPCAMWKQHPTIKQLSSDGWQFGQGPNTE